ncbi:zinc ribbon domain-containing protein [Caldicellulosiruptor morganii]|uniref:Zinc ribbon domain-containing protein n=1 Tax=Caldicellulosiruptor morganii TaxID=1387555 RepID=A0ABY7BNM1_9FIRM|nr:zinc ribbon domain-containing protein [Caldicellulosiruptor morganii]WAM33922.1 zinc ribbon domain-containing protein [Caldicellulosiruptor morganii]
MFFIGIFGIEEKAKAIRQMDVEACPFCGRKGTHTLLKVYNYLHFFFIPVFRWNTRYFIQTGCCSKIYIITNPELARNLEHGANEIISLADVELFRDLRTAADYSNINSDFCPDCGNRVSKHFLYCPYCGRKLE